ncbi:hypothetical protein FRB90_000169 [Tulasnella sp. 427]|nr:hypothetical protein FRB90_000169 [Tulasnella sp. 427]
MKNVEKDLPRVIHSSMSIVLTAFLFANVSYFTVLEKDVVARSNTVALDFGRALLGSLGGVIFSAMVAISCLGALQGGLYTSSRLVYASGQEGFLPKFFGRLNGRLKTPVNATALHASLTIVFIIFGGGFRSLVNFYSVAGWGFYFLTVVGLLVLRIKEPNLDRPYKTWLITPLTFSAVALFLLFMPVAAAPLEAMAAIGFILVGIPVFYLTRERPSSERGSGILDKILGPCLRLRATARGDYVRAAVEEHEEQMEMLRKTTMLPLNPDDFARAMQQLNLGPAEIGKVLGQPNGIEGLLGKIMSMPRGAQPDFDSVDDMIAIMEKTKENHEREKGLPPFPYQSPPRFSLISAFAQERAKHIDAEKSAGFFATRSSTVGLEPHVSKRSLDQLRPIQLSQMMVRQTHVESLLICRIVTPAKRTVAVQFGAEDSAGDVVMVSLYNYPGTIGAKVDSLDSLFPIGTVLAIKEPTLKTSAAGNSVPHWRTGARASLAPEPPSTEEGWKTLGNKYFQGGHFTSAALAYSTGLAQVPSSQVLRLNRAMTYLKLSHAGAALSDCEKTLAQTTLPAALRMKALHRKAQALYGLGRWGEAGTAFEAVGSEFPSEATSSRQWIEKCHKRRQENETGNYNWVEMYNTSLSNPRLDVADYKGDIEVVAISSRGGGRGVVTTADVVAGQLLVVSKAFVSAFPEDCDPPEILLIQNLIKMVAQHGCGALLGTKVAERIAGDPSCAQLVYDLYAGPSFPSPPSSYVMDRAPSNGIERYLNFDVPVDISRIEGVLSFNAFRPSGLPLPSKKESDHPDALFLLPSLFNHSCDPNAAWVCIGDIMVVRATRDISKGSEVLISYRPGESSFIKRQEKLKHYFGKCTCGLCALDRADGESLCKKRDDLEAKISTWDTVSEARQGIQNLEQTYKKKRKHHDPTMTHAQFHLARVQLQDGDVTGFFRTAMSALEQAGLKIIDKSIKGPLRNDHDSEELPIKAVVPPMMGVMAETYIQICISISNAFGERSQDFRRGQRWAATAMWLHDLRYGGGTELFHAHLLDPKLQARLSNF